MGVLSGKKIAVTRPQDQQDSLCALIQQAGGEVLRTPLIKVAPCYDPQKLFQLLENAPQYDWICFTSVNGVKLVFDFAQKENCLVFLKKSRFASIGPATQKALQELGMTADLVPETYQAEGLLEVFEKIGISGKKFLLLRAKGARPILKERLVEEGGHVVEFSIYETMFDENGMNALAFFLQNNIVDVVTFTSSSTVQAFLKLLQENHLLLSKKNLVLASIGPVTTHTLLHGGLWVDVEAKVSTTKGLADALIEFFKDGDKVAGLV